MLWHWYVYILECGDGSYYVGQTSNLAKRIDQHNSGDGANHTYLRGPVKLIYTEQVDSVASAVKRERQLKGWSRAKKEALIKGDFQRLKELSRCKNST